MEYYQGEREVVINELQRMTDLYRILDKYNKSLIWQLKLNAVGHNLEKVLHWNSKHTAEGKVYFFDCYDSGFFRCTSCNLQGNLRTFKEYRCSMVRDTKDTKNTLEIKDNTETATKDTKSNLVLLRGGKSEGTTNWLLELPVGSVFLCKKKNTLNSIEYVAYQFWIDWKGERGVLLSSNLPAKLEIAVDAIGFVETHDLVEVQRRGDQDEPSDQDP